MLNVGLVEAASDAPKSTAPVSALANGQDDKNKNDKTGVVQDDTHTNGPENGVGHTVHGNGNGYGHEKDREQTGGGSTNTPVPPTASPSPETTQPSATPVAETTATPVPGTTTTPVAGTTTTPVPGATATPVPGTTATPVPGTTATPVPGSTATAVAGTTATGTTSTTNGGNSATYPTIVAGQSVVIAPASGAVLAGQRQFAPAVLPKTGSPLLPLFPLLGSAAATVGWLLRRAAR